MDPCRVEYCGKVANLDGLCLFHRKKDVAGQLDHDGGRVYDTCAQHHRWTPENTHWESNQKGGKRRRCRKCLAEKQERKRNEPPVVDAPEPVRLESPVLFSAFSLFDRTQNIVDAKCRDEYATFTDYDGDHIPTDVEAAKMCTGCPMLELCANNAVATRPGWGVWGGQAWVYGQPYTGDRSVLDAED